jgi:hypothetical protein
MNVPASLISNKMPFKKSFVLIYGSKSKCVRIFETIHQTVRRYPKLFEMLQQSVIRHSFLPSFPYARMCDMVVVANEGKKKNLK